MGNCFRKIMSNVLSFTERFAIFTSFISILSCAILCMLCMLAFGIGLGYNYSYVDFRARHTYIKGVFKKTQPTNYYGPGYFKPSTNFPNQPTKKRPNMRKRVKGVHALDPDVTYEAISEPPHGLPHDSPVEIIKNELALQTPLPIQKIETVLIEQLYFNNITTKPRLLTVSLNDSTTEMVTDSNVAAAYMNARREGEAIEEGNNDVNAMKYLSEREESVTVNVTKTHNDSAPFIIKTMMHPNHLSKWLSRLRQANKTFAVHVITN